MPPAGRLRREPADGRRQRRLSVATPGQEAHELLRPVALFGRASRAGIARLIWAAEVVNTGDPIAKC